MHAFTRVGKNLSELPGTREIGRSFLSINQDLSDSRGRRRRPWGLGAVLDTGEGGQKEEGPSAKNLLEKPTLCPTSGNRAWKALTWPAVLGAAPSLPEYVWVGPFGIRGWRGVGAQTLSCM